jgi:hypothetical protein
MKRAEVEADQMPGQDSFLDVITNIVGILILLVLVVGLRTSRAVHDASDNEVAINTGSEAELEKVYSAATDSEKNVRELVHRVSGTRRETILREQERLWLNTVVAGAQQEIEAHRAKLTDDEQREFDVRRQLADAQTRLEQLTREQIALVSQGEPTEQIECEPTPLAKVVTGTQVHLLLADDHVAVVPFDELVEQAKQDAGENIWRLKQQDELDRTIGPINGFRLRYWFVKAEVVARTQAGSVVAGNIPQFSHCYFLPVTSPAGEPAAESLRPDSELHQYLRGLRADSTTVTIWTYPGNFDRLRELKRDIRALGFQIAVRPLPPGVPIGASRHGSDSLAE